MKPIFALTLALLVTGCASADPGASKSSSSSQTNKQSDPSTADDTSNGSDNTGHEPGLDPVPGSDGSGVDAGATVETDAGATAHHDAGTTTDSGAKADGGGDAAAAGKAFGEACTVDGDCASKACFVGGQGNYCSIKCTTNTDCPVPPTSGTCNPKGYCKK